MIPRRVQRWLVALSDPACELPLPRQKCRDGDRRLLVDLAARHGVLPAVAEALRRTGVEHDAAMAAARERRVALAALTLALRAQLREVLAALAAAGTTVLVLKGAEAADRLYPAAHLRPFTDIDLLVRPDDAGAASAALADLGYRRAEASMKYDAGYAETAWQRPGRPAGGTVELHWNLVNSPTLRAAVSVALDDLATAASGEASLPALRAAPASLLLIAAVHGAAHHGFDRLQLLWDVAQCARGAAGPIDAAWLAQAAGRTGAGLALRAALDLAGRVLGVAACGELAGRLGLPAAPRSLRMLLTRGVVLRAHAWRDSFRRQAFRRMLKRPRRAPAVEAAR